MRIAYEWSEATARAGADSGEDWTMLIRFTSTMTAEDEIRAATALTEALKHLLAPFPIGYAVRIETTAGDVIVDSCADVQPDWWPGSGRRTNGDGRERRTVVGSSS